MSALNDDSLAGARLVKRSVTLSGHRTSVSLEDAFWAALKSAAARRGWALNALIAEIDRLRAGNLSSALRVFALQEALTGPQIEQQKRPGE